MILSCSIPAQCGTIELEPWLEYGNTDVSPFKSEGNRWEVDWMEVTKNDWKLFRARIGSWQEAYMEKLNQEYIELLSGEGPASEKFWALEARIKEDKRNPGVLIELRKQRLPFDLARLLCDEVIQVEDLDGFSDELVERALYLYRY